MLNWPKLKKAFCQFCALWTLSLWAFRQQRHFITVRFSFCSISIYMCNVYKVHRQQYVRGSKNLNDKKMESPEKENPKHNNNSKNIQYITTEHTLDELVNFCWASVRCYFTHNLFVQSHTHTHTHSIVHFSDYLYECRHHKLSWNIFYPCDTSKNRERKKSTHT